jgi:outer membrane immunogenic protein
MESLCLPFSLSASGQLCALFAVTVPPAWWLMLSPTRNTRQKPSNGTFCRHTVVSVLLFCCEAKGAWMKKALLASAALGTLFIGNPSLAADLGVRGPWVAAIPVFTWTGCYVGTHVGGGWADETITAPAIVPGVSVTGHTAGVLGGGQVGCNLQFGGNWVIGIEGEGSAADIKGDTNQTILGITGTASAKTDWIASATARLGYTWDRWLIYGKGGAAWAHNNYSLSIPVFPEHETASDTRTGWTAGGGVEWAFWSNWSMKAEYNYYDFGTSSVTLVGTFAGVPIEVPGIEIRQRISVGKFGVNYRF